MAAITLKAGARVLHDRYGPGAIKEIPAPPLGQATQALVDFDTDRFPVPRRVWLADLREPAALPLAPRAKAPALAGAPKLRVVWPVSA